VTSGPNFPCANGALIPSLEKTLDYAYAVVIKMQNEGMKSLSPKQECVTDFQEHKDNFMKGSVFTTPCRSWYVSSED